MSTVYPSESAKSSISIVDARKQLGSASKLSSIEKSRAWIDLASYIHQTGGNPLQLGEGIKGQVTYIECLTCALNENPENYQAYLLLSSIEGWSTFTLSGVNLPGKKLFWTLTRPICYQKALQGGFKEMPKNKAMALLLKVANGIHGEQKVLFDGREWTRVDCLLKALELSSPDTNSQIIATLFREVARCLSQGEEVAIEGQSLDAKGCYLKALEQNPNASILWIELACLLTLEPYDKEEDIRPVNQTVLHPSPILSGSVIFRDQNLNHLDCIERALVCDPHCSRGWTMLGTFLFIKNEVRVLHFPIEGDVQVSCIDCHLRYLSLAYACEPPLPVASTWSLIALGLNREDTVLWYDTSLSRNDCIVKSLEADPNYVNSWKQLAVFLRDGPCSSLQISGVEYTAQKSFLQALELNPNDSSSWKLLAGTMSPKESITLKGKKITFLACCIKALERDPQSNEWISIAKCMDPTKAVKVGKKEYTQLQCYVEAIRLGDRSGSTWCTLGSLLTRNQTVVIGEKTLTSIDCYVRAVHANSKCPEYWKSLGLALDPSMEVLIGDKMMKRVNCLIWVVILNEKDAVSWSHLGDCLALLRGSPAELEKLGTFTDLQCYIKALELNLKDNPERLWYALAAKLQKGETVEFNGNSFSALDCIIRALNLKPKNSENWLVLGSLIEQGETIQLGKKKVTNTQCFIKAVTFDRQCSDAWGYLGFALRKGETVAVGQESITSQGCYVRALESDFENKPVWYNLAFSLEKDETVKILGKYFTGKECLQHAFPKHPLK